MAPSASTTWGAPYRLTLFSPSFTFAARAGNDDGLAGLITASRVVAAARFDRNAAVSALTGGL